MTKHYHKLVRDKIPQIIEESGKACKTRILSREEYRKMLDEKLEEELAEYQESKSLEELADLLENIDNAVVFGLKRYWGVLISLMGRTKSDLVYCKLLDCFNKGLHNCD